VWRASTPARRTRPHDKWRSAVRRRRRRSSPSVVPSARSLRPVLSVATIAFSKGAVAVGSRASSRRVSHGEVRPRSSAMKICGCGRRRSPRQHIGYNPHDIDDGIFCRASWGTCRGSSGPWPSVRREVRFSRTSRSPGSDDRGGHIVSAEQASSFSRIPSASA
jgi:hypothetical protein